MRPHDREYKINQRPAAEYRSTNHIRDSAGERATHQTFLHTRLVVVDGATVWYVLPSSHFLSVAQTRSEVAVGACMWWAYESKEETTGGSHFAY